MNEYLKMKNLIMRMLCIVFCVFWSFNSFAQKENQIDWKSDIEFLKNELPKRHKNLFFKYSREDFNSSLDQLKLESNSLSDLQIGLRIQQIIVKVGDSHTNFNYGSFLRKSKSLPFFILWLSDGITIYSTTKGNEKILGAKLKKINGSSIETIIDSLSTLFVVDNEASKKIGIPGLIQNDQLLDYFGFMSGHELTLEVEDETGKTFTHNLVLGEMHDSTKLEINPLVVPYYRTNPTLFFIEKYFEEDSIYFIQYNKCWSRELEEGYGDKEKVKGMPSFIEFEQAVFKTIREKTIKKLIVDLRFNSGGSSLQGTDFIKQLAGIESINKRNKIYVVVGRRTFSSGILNVMDFQRYTKAVIIGEETSGKPNHFGEIKKMMLPSSKIAVSYSTKYFQMASEKLKTIEPDVKCSVSFLEYKNGVDPVYEYVRKK